MRWLLSGVVGILALIGIGASVSHYLMEPYNPGFLRFQVMTAFHVILGGIYLTLAPLQFVKRIRTRWLDYHRWAGRLLVAIGLVIGTTALFMGWVIPFSGWTESIYISIFGSLFLVSLWMGYRHVRAGNIALHREWMIRSFAVGLSIATMRVIFIPALVIAVNPSTQQIAMLSGLSFAAAFVVHAALAELWIRVTRKGAMVRRTPARATSGFQSR
jgi:uncharacterized membrane protein